MGTYFDLKDFKVAKDKELAFLNKEGMYISRQEDFLRIPGAPIAYWASKKTVKNFSELKKISNYADGRIGLITGDGGRFIKFWHEVSLHNIGFGIKDNQESIDSGMTWFPIQNGGGYRKWYGNIDSVVNWRNDGYDMKFDNSLKGRVRSHNYNGEFAFRRGISWTTISTSKFSCRYAEGGYIFDTAGPFCIPKNQDDLYLLLGLLQSKITENYMAILNPTINFPPGYITSLPFDLGLFDNETKEKINSLVSECIEYSMQDWNSFETAWGFTKHPLVCGKSLVSDAFQVWKDACEQRISRLANNESRLNEIYINAYGLSSELDPIVKEEEITVRKSELKRDIESLISYAVGCAMGRYSIDSDGVVYAGGQWDISQYRGDFKPCEYGVLPITENQFFEEDLCTKVFEFIKIVYGEETLTENLRFIASALKPESYEAPKKIIREYLFNDFFDNHFQNYQHRPIYWQLDSGKAGGFRAIVYMHRFNENTLPLIRTEFIQDLRYKYEEEMQRQKARLEGASTTAEKNAVKKDITALDKKIVECAAYDELLNHATSSIQNYLFDLDDGVKTNYAKFLSIDGDKNSNILTVVKL